MWGPAVSELCKYKVVILFSDAVAVWKQPRFFVDNLMYSVNSILTIDALVTLRAKVVHKINNLRRVYIILRLMIFFFFFTLYYSLGSNSFGDEGVEVLLESLKLMTTIQQLE